MEHMPTPRPDTESVTTSPTKDHRSNARNTAIIITFFAALILVAWLSTLAITHVPSAFSSLANLVESISGRNERSLTITNSTTAVRSGDQLTISWHEVSVPGTFTFSYACVHDVVVSIIGENSTRDVRCDSIYSLGAATTTTLIVKSAASGETTVPFTIAFLRTNDIEAKISGSGQFTISPQTEEEVPSPVTPEVTSTPSPEPENPPVVATPVPEVPRPTTPVAPVVLVVPVSDPNGTTDLAVRFIAIGIQNNTIFTPQTTLQPGRENALRFEVKNHGTKTSDQWSYRVELPDGSTYEAEEQKPLKPNERATLTITFDLPREMTGSVRTSVVIETPSDQTSINDRFTQTLPVSR